MSAPALGGLGPRPTVSALMTTFNHRPYVVEALDSLLSQTHPLTEILVADDGSADGTPELVAPFARFGVTLLRTSNGGPSRAMNALLRRARGDVLLLHSGDDVSHPDRAAAQLRQLETSELAASTPRLIDGAGGELPSDAFPVFSDPPQFEDGLALFSRLLFTGNFICAPAAAMRRSVFEAVGFFHEGLLQLQDHHYWMRAAAKGFRLDVSRRAYASYRVHDKNLSRSANDRRTAVELPYMVRSAVEALDQEQLLTLLYGRRMRVARHPSITSLRALMFLRHRLPDVRRLGLELLIHELGEEGGRARLRDALGVEPAAVFALMATA